MVVVQSHGSLVRFFELTGVAVPAIPTLVRPFLH
jgi:hypothetical protein